MLPKRSILTIEIHRQRNARVGDRSEGAHGFARVGDQNPYCTAVVAPKLRKFRKSYAERLKQ